MRGGEGQEMEPWLKDITSSEVGRPLSLCEDALRQRAGLLQVVVHISVGEGQLGGGNLIAHAAKQLGEPLAAAVAPALFPELGEAEIVIQRATAEPDESGRVEVALPALPAPCLHRHGGDGMESAPPRGKLDTAR